MPTSVGSICTTHGVKVRVTPSFLPERSAPDRGVFVFAYQIAILNQSDVPVRLVSRQWLIVDADGQRHVVRGEGVVGQQPRLMPGQTFEYASFCPLATDWGTMEGSYQFALDSGEPLEVKVARFYLVAAPQESAVAEE